MDTTSITLSVLSAMIMPAVLISACGSLVTSTNDRLIASMARVRHLSDRLEELAAAGSELKMLDERRKMVFEQLELQTSRAPMLQRILTTLYLAIGVFVATSVTIGIAALTKANDTWVPISFGLLGAGFLTYASILLLIEARLATASVRGEMAFLWRLGKHIAPGEIGDGAKRRRA
ncbi:MAG: DUF2721 domain-containing protein [Acidobacteriota bacterium]